MEMVIPLLVLVGIMLVVAAFGVLVIRSLATVRIDLLFPLGTVTGLTLLIFWLNLASFVITGVWALVLSLVLLFITVLIILNRSRLKPVIGLEKLAWFYWLVPLLLWGEFLFLKAGRVTLGSDTNLYYAIASTFAKGNFPLHTPWQPALPLTYHTGVFELLGSLQLVTGLSFSMIHLFLAGVFILCGMQIVVGLLTKRYSFYSSVYANLSVALVFISFGLFKIGTFPNLTFLRSIKSIQDLLVALQSFPTAYHSLDIYGSTITLDGMFYTFFYPAGLAILFLIAFLVVELKAHWGRYGLILILVSLASLSLVNEAFFFPTSVMLGFVLVKHMLERLRSRKNILGEIIICLFFAVVILFQGGYLTASLRSTSLEKPILFPLFKNDQANKYINTYHLSQTRSRRISESDSPGGIKFVHIGLDVLVVIVALLILVGIKDPFAVFIFGTALAAIVFYFAVTPKYELANGNRVIVMAYQLIALCLLLCLFKLAQQIKSFSIKTGLGAVFLLVAFFSVTGPLLTLRYARPIDNYIKLPVLSAESLWLRQNLHPKDNLLVLDDRAPFTSGAFAQIIDSGISSPTFDSNQRVYTMEPGADYIDSFYTLNPASISTLGANYLLVTTKAYNFLPELRKKQLKDPTLFTSVFSNAQGVGIYRILDKYLHDTPNIPGTLKELGTVAPLQGKFYIGSQTFFDPDFLRRAVIFSLRDRNLYFDHESGVYLHVESQINFHPPEGSDYDYYVLTDKISPQEICSCKTMLLWKGLNDTLFLWKRI